MDCISLRVRDGTGSRAQHAPDGIDHQDAVFLSGNLGTEPRSFTVRERLPVSEVEQVKVKFDPATTGDIEPDDNGFVTWPITLPGAGNATRKLRYSILKRRNVQESS